MTRINLLKPKARIPHWIDDNALEAWTDRLEVLYQHMEALRRHHDIREVSRS